MIPLTTISHREILLRETQKLEGIVAKKLDQKSFSRPYYRGWVWDWAYRARAAILGYRMFRDMEFVDAVLLGALHYVEAGHEHEALDGYGWYSWERSTGRWFREITTAGHVATPILDLLLLAEEDQHVADRISPHAAKLREAVIRGLAGFDDTYRRDGVSAYYVTPLNGDKVEALNHMAVYAVALARLHILTGDSSYKTRVAELAEFWKRTVTIQENGSWSWPYAASPGQINGPGEPFWKATVTIELPIIAYGLGVVVSKQDLLAIASIFPQNIVKPADESWADALISSTKYFLGMANGGRADGSANPLERGAVNLSRSIDGEGGLVQDRNYRMYSTLAMWHMFNCVMPANGRRVNKFLSAIDEEFYLRPSRALYGATYGLHVSMKPDACGRAIQ
jgi:hypothetical protein